MQHMILIRVFLVIFLSDDSFCFPPALETTLALVLLILTGLVSALISVNLINSDGFFGGYNLPGGGGRNFKIRRQRLWWNRTSNLHSFDFCCLTLCGFRNSLNLVRIQVLFLALGMSSPCSMLTLSPLDTLSAGWNQDYPYIRPNQKPS